MFFESVNIVQHWFFLKNEIRWNWTVPDKLYENYFVLVAFSLFLRK